MKSEKTIKDYRKKLPVTASFSLAGLIILDVPLWITLPMGVLISVFWIDAIVSWRRYVNNK